MKYSFFSKIILAIFLPIILLGQGTYYNSINPSSSSFVSDLEARIRSPYTPKSYAQYDETNVANFASRDTTSGQKVVTCVYSGENYVYSGTFAWTTFSREHTFCHSWMPTNPADSPERNEYSDQHHLFPTNQDNANARRSNHPLGEVTSVSYQYLEGKLGLNNLGQTVYEPRESHKGDAARAILYMCLRYDGIDGFVWNFNNLNNNILPNQPQPEAPQDLQTLINWHKQDPPTKWEVDRNNYIQSIQGNRNPLSDHPEYVNYINFDDLTKLSPSYSTEPTNQPTNISVSSVTNSSFLVSWTAAVTGTQAPSGYMIEIYNSNDYFVPIDGSTYFDDVNISDGRGLVNVGSAITSYTFTGLTAGTTYYIRLYSNNGSVSSINYKIDGTILSTTAATTGSGVSLADEPTNYPTNLLQGTITTTSIQLNWTKSITGIQAPTGYFLKASSSSSITAPTDGTVYLDDTNLSDNSATVNLDSSLSSYTFSGLSQGTTYYFKLFPFNGSSGSRNYKTDGTVPNVSVNTITDSSAGSGPSDLFISEYIEGSSNNKVIEIYNGTATTINLTSGLYKLEIYFNGSATPSSPIALSGSIPSGGVFVVANSSSNSSILSVANVTSTSLNFNGDDAVLLKKGSIVLDAIGQVGFDPGTEWGAGLQSTADNTIVRKNSISTGDTTTSNLFDPSVEWDGYAIDTFSYLGSHSGPLLPVELVSFSATVINSEVLLRWSTATELNNYGFEILRRFTPQNDRHSDTERSEMEESSVGFVEGSGTTNAPNAYSFIDNAVASGTYSYRLKQIDRDGRFEYSNTVEVAVGFKPTSFELFQNYPNPFNPATVISYQLPVNSHITLKVFDGIGREVALLVNDTQEAGYYSVQFNGMNFSTGIYHIVLKNGNNTRFKKMLLLK